MVILRNLKTESLIIETNVKSFKIQFKTLSLKRIFMWSSLTVLKGEWLLNQTSAADGQKIKKMCDTQCLNPVVWGQHGLRNLNFRRRLYRFIQEGCSWPKMVKLIVMTWNPFPDRQQLKINQLWQHIYYRFWQQLICGILSCVSFSNKITCVSY